MNKISQQLWLKQWLKQQEPYMGLATTPEDWDNLKTVMCVSIMAAVQRAKINHTEVVLEATKVSFNGAYKENINMLKSMATEELAFPEAIKQYVDFSAIKIYLIYMMLRTNTEGLAEIIGAIVEKDKIDNNISVKPPQTPSPSSYKI